MPPDLFVRHQWKQFALRALDPEFRDETQKRANRYLRPTAQIFSPIKDECFKRIPDTLLRGD